MEFFEFSSDALYPSLNNNDLIMQPLETTNSLSAQPTEDIPRSQTETNRTYNSTEFVMENIARTQQTVPHPVTSAVTSSNLNDWVSSNSDSVSGSVYNEQGMTETTTNYSPSYLRFGMRQQSQFPENVTTATTYSPVTQEIRPVAVWAQQYPESQSISRNTNIRLARSRQQNPYFRGVPTSTLHRTRPLAEGTAISRHQQQTTFNNPSNTLSSNSGQSLLPQTQQHQVNFAFVSSIPENQVIRAQSGQETQVTTVNHSVEVAMGDGNVPQNLANVTIQQQSQVQTESGSSVIPETSGMDGLDRSTLPVQQVLRQLVETIKSPNCTAEQQYQAVRILRSDPRLMAAFLQMRQRSASSHGNTSNISNMTTNQHQQSGAAYRTTPNMTEHMKFPWMMTGGSVRVTSSAVPHYNSYAVGAMQNQDNSQQPNISSQGEMTSSSNFAGYPTHTETGRMDTSSWNNNQPSSSSSTYLPLEISSAGQDVINKGGLSRMANSATEPGVTAILQLAAARQLIVQASASAAAAGANSLSQTLNDRTLSLDRVMTAHCPSFLHGGRMQMKALLSLTSSANSQLSAPRIPTCSICLDKLVATILLPCGHFFCETCALKIEKCGLCRELIANKHRVYF
ncbi:hypothetical protein DAPPUDRAFT_306240 [Daphnia pulex]|uniref:RING-type domain-containing protein n=1 Tax=Daphnia pulex TaxID=6669 RepID=E9GW09_DAPPU|nr:hypothetical protein DAPPUDRAFT_306240 [Daphnia pulex]|eukprot:EFX76353.1 hypothetical protein DAPPUDRAFT_306240 [Daphnia pulex]